MNIFVEIIKWAKTLPPWEQEAVHRLVANGEITPEDEEELLELLKSKDADAPKPPQIDDPQPDTVAAVSLVSLEHTCGVNALSEGEVLEFGTSPGLTVIYGDNGSGKSGYSRILKNACRAREKKPEQILSDVFCDGATPSPRAKFTYSDNGTEQTEDWTPDTTTSDALGSIAVFDSHCARSYVEEDGEPAYLPYGLEVFPKLATTCSNLKSKLEAEARALPQSNPENQFTTPKVRNAITTLMSKNIEKNRDALAELAKLSDKEKKRMATLETTIAQLRANDPAKLAQSRRKLATRLDKQVPVISAASTTFAEQLKLAPERAKERDEKQELADEASQVAFGDEPVQGVGTEQWKSLFEYAREFSTEVAYTKEGQEFPYVGEDAHCVLCHQPLNADAKDRMTRFAEFVEDRAAKDAKKAAEDYAQMVSKLMTAANKLADLDDALIDQVEEHSKEAADELRTAKDACVDLIVDIEAAETEEDWKAITAPSLATAELTKLSARLKTEADEYEKNSNAEERRKLEEELLLLQERQRLGKSLKDILKDASTAAKRRRLQKLANDITTNHITHKNRELTKQVLTQGLCDALNQELKDLGAAKRLQVEFASKGGGGSQPHYLRFKDAPKDDLRKVLSEGEHRCLGIAAFLAELNQGGHTSAIILDDPVSSLDHKHRYEVARRLAEEAKHRQVVIFTHDLAFQCSLEKAATELGVPMETHTVGRTTDGTGVVLEVGTYPETLGLGQLINDHIPGLAREATSLDEDDPSRRAKVVRCYELMRAGYERVVSEVLLNGVVRSLEPDVHTKQLDGVEVSDEDHAHIYAAMGKCSELIEAHRTAPAGGTTRIPDNEELQADVDELKAFFKKSKDERKAAKERRGS